jgi:hypothetical protein
MTFAFWKPAADARRAPSLAVLASLAIGLPLMARALVHPALLFDDWYYHLPFAAALFGLGGDTFHWSEMVEARWRGFPLMWDFVLGMVWSTTGSLRFLLAPQVALIGLYLFGAASELEIRVSWLALAFFACPLLLIHGYVAYNDLPVAIGIAGAALLTLRMIAGAQATSWRAGLVVAGFALAGNIKFQGEIAVFAVAAGLAALALWRGKARLCGVLAVGVAIGCASSVANFVNHDNPVYPIEVRALGRVIFAGPESPAHDANFPTYDGPSGAPISLPEPVNFLLSASELDFALRGVPFGYNVDQVAGLQPARGAPARTGGWGAIFVLANAVALIAQLRRRRRLAPDQRLYLIAAVGAFALCCVLPRAHELRYWLFGPLLISAVNVRWLASWEREDAAELTLVALALTGVCLCALSPKSELLRFRAIDPPALAAQRPAAVVEALAASGRFCDPDDLTLFIFSRAATGETGLVSNRAEDCR